MTLILNGGLVRKSASRTLCPSAAWGGHHSFCFGGVE